MTISKTNVTKQDWNNGTRLLCPYLRIICGTWIAIKENPCGKHKECVPCAQSSKNKVIVINET